jgi:hypothetical protein
LPVQDRHPSRKVHHGAGANIHGYHEITEGEKYIALRPKEAQELVAYWNASCRDYFYSLTPPMDNYRVAKALVDRVDRIANFLGQ